MRHKYSSIYFALLLCLSISIGGKLHAADELADERYESESITRGKADLYQALRKRSIKQIDVIDLTLEELAQAINANTIKVSDKKVFIDHIITLRAFLDKLKKERIIEFNEKNLILIAQINKEIIIHIHKILDKGPKSFKHFDDLPIRAEFQLLKEETVLDRAEAIGESNFSRVLIMLGANDQALKSLIEKNRLAGASAFNRFFQKTEKEAKRNKLHILFKRSLPYGILGLYCLYLTAGDKIPAGFQWLKTLVGGKQATPAPAGGVPAAAPAPAAAAALPAHGIFGTPSLYFGDINITPQNLINAAITLYFANRIQDDAKDLYGWFSEKAKKVFTKLKGESYEDPSPVKASKISFTDIAGYDHAKNSLQTIVNYFKSKEFFDRMGTHVDRGYLLVGPLDIGKQLTHGLADAITQEVKKHHKDAKCGIYEVHSSALVKKDIADMIKEVEKESPVYPCIILIDDLDWLVDHAKSKPSIWGDLVAAMNSNLRGNKKQIFIFAAARDTSKIYATIKGQGRLGSLVQFGKPTVEERKAFFVKELSKRGARAQEFDITRLALHTKNCSYDILTSIVRKAFGMAHAQKEIAAQRHIEHAIESIVHGIMHHEQLDPKEQEMLAVHYAGRALAHSIINPALPFKVTTLPMGIEKDHALAQGGFIVHTTDNHHHFITEQDLAHKAVITLAGTQAEKLINSGNVAQGLAKKTKQQAFEHAKQIVFQGITGKDLSKKLKNEKLDSVWQKVEQFTQEAQRLLENNKDPLLRIAQALKEKRVLTSEEIQALIE